MRELESRVIEQDSDWMREGQGWERETDIAVSREKANILDAVQFCVLFLDDISN